MIRADDEKLPGEVARFDRDGATYAILGGHGVGYVHGYRALWRCATDSSVGNPWTPADLHKALALWAEHERSVAEAERALRYAGVLSAKGTPHEETAKENARRACAKLRALGVEP